MIFNFVTGLHPTCMIAPPTILLYGLSQKSDCEVAKVPFLLFFLAQTMDNMNTSEFSAICR